jgi:ATP-binding cassette, subfamily C (CFTR/MRP), member 1
MASPPSNCTFKLDSAFGPAVQTGCRGGFDFTLAFEHAILTLLPAGSFSLVFLARFVQLARSDVKRVSHTLRRVKFAASLLFVAVQAALVVVLHTQGGLTRTALSLTAAAINLVVSLQFVALSWIEDSRSVRPSTPLLLYLCLTILLDLPQGRSLWLLGTNSALAALFSAQLGIKLALLALEGQQRRSYPTQDYAALSPESTSGIISRSFLWWINLFLYQGFSTLISVDDLFELDDELRSDQVAKRLQQEWEARQKPERRFELVVALSQALWWPLLQAAAPRLCFVAFSLAQPLLISSILDLVSGPADDTMSTNKGYGLIGATFLVYAGIAISNLLYFQNMNRCVTMSRGALVALIYERALLVPDGLYDESTAITLMSSDTALIGTSMERVHDIWAYTAQVAIGVYLLARQIGWVCVMPLLVVVGECVPT